MRYNPGAMGIIDISVLIRTGMVTYPGDPEVRLERVKAIADGEPANISKLDFGVHTGTHVDAPSHFIDGAAGAEQLPLDALNGPCEVVAADSLDESAVAAVPTGAERVLFKTPNSELWAQDSFADEFERLNGAAAKALVQRGVRLVGVDYLSVGDEVAHHELLGAGVVPIEGLDLRGVEPGSYELHCLPLRLVDSDGAPARAILVRR
jgi:arylformamidase